MEKRGIKLKKILIDCFRFWYLLVIFAAIGVFVGYRGGISFNKNVDSLKKEAAEKKEQEEQELIELSKDKVQDVTFTKAQCEKELTKAEQKEVSDAYGIYLSRQERREYFDNSSYLNLNPYQFSSTYLEFRVITPEEDWKVSDFNSYVHGLKNYVNFNGLAEDLAAGDDLLFRQLGELLTVTDGGKESYDNFLVVTVVNAPETTERIDEITKKVIAKGDALAKIYPGFRVQLETKYKADYYNAGLNSAIDTQRSGISGDKTKIEKAIKKFTPMQHAYYEMMVNGTEEETVQEVLLSGASATKKKSTTTIEIPSKRNLKVMAALGGAAGLFVAVIVIFFMNLLSGRLLFGKDFTGIFDVRCFGILRERKKKSLPGKLQQMEYPEAEDAENPNYIYLQIREIMNSKECKDAILLGTGEFSSLTGVEKLVNMIKNDGIMLTKEDSFPSDLKAAERVLQKRSVILVETLHKSKMKQIEKMIRFCKENEVDILGAICIDGTK